MQEKCWHNNLLSLKTNFKAISHVKRVIAELFFTTSLTMTIIQYTYLCTYKYILCMYVCVNNMYLYIVSIYLLENLLFNLRATNVNIKLWLRKAEREQIYHFTLFLCLSLKYSKPFPIDNFPKGLIDFFDKFCENLNGILSCNLTK